MSTGNFEDWTGNITEIGAIYPFVGTEFMLFIIGLVFWIWWHVVQTRAENRQYEEEIKRFGSADSLKSMISREDPENP